MIAYDAIRLILYVFNVVTIKSNLTQEKGMQEKISVERKQLKWNAEMSRKSIRRTEISIPHSISEQVYGWHHLDSL